MHHSAARSLLALAISVAVGRAAAATTPVFINEIHYDNAGTDTGEFVEIAGPARTDLTGWSLEFYNGSTGSGYGIQTLGGLIPDVTNGFGMLLFSFPGLQNGAPDGVALVDDDDNVVQFLSYEGSFTAVGGPADGLTSVDIGVSEGSSTQVGESLQLAGTGTHYEDFTWRSPVSETRGEANNDQTFGDAPPPPEPTITFISEVQGAGASSPLVGNTVTVQGIVVGDFQDGSGIQGDLNGFFVQEEEADDDFDPRTSEGIFVYDGSSPPVDVAVGDLVRVTGSVSEYNGLTELTSISDVEVIGSGSLLPEATVVSLPRDAVDDFEAVEGMLVTFPQELYVSEYFNFDRFGEIVLTSTRYLTPTAEFEPGSLEAVAAEEAYQLDRITFDDGRTSQNPDPAIHPNGSEFDLTNRFRGGDILQDVTGVMDFAFGLWRVQPTAAATYVEANPRPENPEDVGGEVKVASFNVLNYFPTIDQGADICGPSEDLECRGADTAEEFTRQRDKIITAITTIDADVVGLLEIENNVDDEAVMDLVDGLDAVAGSGTYDYIATGPIGTDAIKVALIYKPASVSPLGNYAVLDGTVDSRFIDTKNRPVLAQSFEDIGSGNVFTVAVNHLKSKGSDCDDLGDPDLGDGQGNCNLTRLAAAQALVDWLATDPTGSGDPDFLILGDLNSYDKEDPIDAVKAGSDDLLGTTDDFTDLVFAYQGEEAYSYLFDGRIGYLDYAFANHGLASQVTGVSIWHINADEPDLLDYDMSFKKPAQDAIYAPDAFRSSDHDPVLVGLDLNASPVCRSARASEDLLWPANHKFQSVQVQGVQDPEGGSVNVTVTSVFQDEPVNGKGDGNTEPDAQIVPGEVLLRAERDGGGDGRVYHVAFTAQDASGAQCAGEVAVAVPKSQGKISVDGGALYDSTQP